MSDEKYRAILEKDPTDTQAFVALCNSAERNNDYPYLVQLYNFRAQVIADTKEIADLHFKAGEIYLDKLEDMAQGVQALLAGFEADKTHAGIGDRLDATYREAGDWESAVQIAEQRLEALTKADGNGTKTVIRSDLHQQAGEIWEKVYADKAKALVHYKKAIELDKTNLLALYSAREIYYEAGKFKNAAKLCELEARCEKDPDRRAALYRELAHIFSKKLLDQDQAVVALKRSLKFSPKNKDIKMDLSKAISTTALTADNEKDHKWAAEYLLRSAASADENDALLFASQAIKAFPSDSRGFDLIESKGEASGDWGKVTAIYEEIITKLNNPKMREPVIRRLAQVYETKLQDPSTAAAWLGKIGAAGTAAGAPSTAPEAPAAVSAPAEPIPSEAPIEPVKPTMPPADVAPSSAPQDAVGLSPAQQASPSVGVPVREDGMSDAQFVDALRKAADRARRSGDDATAEECLLEVLDVEPHDQKATTYLERRFRARSDWLSLRDLLLRSSGAAHLPQAVQTVRLREAARLSEEQLGDVLGAIEAWQTIKTNDPKVRDATDALIRLYDQAERWEELLVLLKQEIEATKSRTKKVDALRRLANIYYQRVGELGAAAKAFRAVLKLSPDDSEAIEALDDIYLKNGDYEELVQLLRKRADLSKSREEKRNHLFKAAMVLRDNLERGEEAYALGKEILTISRDDQEVVEFLISIDESAEQWQRLIGLLEIRTRFAQSTDEKVALIRKRASIALEKLDDPRLSAKAYNEVLAVAPTDVDAMTALAQIHRDGGDWGALVDVLKQQIGATTDKMALTELHREMARTLEHELKREEEAMASWHAVLDIAPDAESLGALARYYERNKKWNEYVNVIEQQAVVAETHTDRAEILYNRAVIIDQELGDRDRAMKELERILNEVDPTHDSALNLLTEILVEKRDFERAADLLDQRISYAKDKNIAKSLLIQLGTWAKDELDDLERAVEAFERAVGLDREDDASLDLLDEAYVAAKEWEKLLKMIYARAKGTSDDNERLDRLVRGAKICEEELEDKNKAWTWYVEMLDNLSHLPETLEIVEASARRMELWKELIDLAGVMTRSAQLESDQVVWWLKAADILEEKMSDPAQALEAVLRAFGLEPDNRELLDRVDRLAVVVGNWQRLSTVYGVLVKRAAEKEDKVALLKRYATVLRDEAKRPSDAFDISVKAFEIDPDNDDLLSMVEEMGQASKRWDDLIRIYGACAKMADEVEKKIDLKMREAVVFRDKKADTDGALVAYIQGIQIEPFDNDIREKIWAEIRNLESDLVPSESGTYWNKLIEAYRILASEHKKEPEQQVELLICVSEIYVSELSDISSAFDCMKEIQQINPKDEGAIDKLEVLAAKNDYWEELADHYQDILDETFEMDVAIMLHRRRARILEEELKRGDEASEHYWQIIQLDSKDTRAYGKLMAYYESTEKWNELVNMLERQLDNTQEDEGKKAILFRIAEIWEEEIGNRYEAKDWYEQVLTMWPDDERAKASLSRLVESKSATTDQDEDAASEEEGDDDDDINALISLPPPTGDDEDEDEDEDASDSAAHESAETATDGDWQASADDAPDEAESDIDADNGDNGTIADDADTADEEDDDTVEAEDDDTVEAEDDDTVEAEDDASLEIDDADSVHTPSSASLDVADDADDALDSDEIVADADLASDDVSLDIANTLDGMPGFEPESHAATTEEGETALAPSDEDTEALEIDDELILDDDDLLLEEDDLAMEDNERSD